MKDFKKLSERQRNILRFIQRHINNNGYPPTIRQIGSATAINSTSVVNYNLNKLVSAGYLERSGRTSRGLRLIAPIPGVRKKITRLEQGSSVPLIGRIVASEPVSVPDDVGHYYDEDDMLEVPPTLLNGIDPSEAYALRVHGDSMIDAMIQDGDIVIMHRQETAQNGEMVAVWLPDNSETTLKHFFHEGDQIRLQPAHPAMDPIFVSLDNCQIQGKVLSVIRQVH